MVGEIGLGELQCYAALGVGDTEFCSVERLGVDDGEIMSLRVYLGESNCLHELCHGETYLLHALRQKPLLPRA